MISLTTQTSSSYALKLRDTEKSKIRDFSRRVNRSATLDGSSVVTDLGYTNTDRILTVEARAKESQWEQLEYMIQNYALLNVSTHGEFFSAAMSQLKENNGKAVMTFLIQE